jgi:hypothetical protein
MRLRFASAAALGCMLAAPAFAGALVQAGVFENFDFTNAPVLQTDYVNQQQGTAVFDDLAWAFNCNTCIDYTLQASGEGKIVDGVLGAQSSLTVTGNPPLGAGYSAWGTTTSDYDDTLKIGGGSGLGVLALRYLFEGSATETPSNAGVDQSSATLSVSGVAGTRVQVNSSPLSNGDSIKSTGDINYNFLFTFYIPFAYDTAFNIEPALSVTAKIDQRFQTPPVTVTWDFLHTAELQSAIVYDGTPDSLGPQNNLATIAGTAGLDYGPNGITAGAVATPEPSSAWLGLLVLPYLRKKRSML